MDHPEIGCLPIDPFGFFDHGNDIFPAVRFQNPPHLFCAAILQQALDNKNLVCFGIQLIAVNIPKKCPIYISDGILFHGSYLNIQHMHKASET